jgi:hypothetical protein
MTARTGLTDEQANKVYDILVQHAGAQEDGRWDFVFHQTRGHVTEYRFMGLLGFGGKFWRTHWPRWYVSAYPEDLVGRPERHDAIRLTNAALGGLHASYAALAVVVDEEPVL